MPRLTQINYWQRLRCASINKNDLSSTTVLWSLIEHIVKLFKRQMIKDLIWVYGETIVIRELWLGVNLERVSYSVFKSNEIDRPYFFC